MQSGRGAGGQGGGGEKKPTYIPECFLVVPYGSSVGVEFRLASSDLRVERRAGAPWVQSKLLNREESHYALTWV